MTTQKPKARRWHVPNMEPTLNGTGFMFKVLDDYAKEFIRFAGECPDPVLELGCAYGVATIPALETGATITACDLEQGHLDILLENTPEEDRSRLTCVAGALPYVDFPQEKFGAILCSRVLHFLDGGAVDASVRKMYGWLKPGGRLYLVADTPYGIWRKFIPIFEARKAEGKRWPGLMIGLEYFLPNMKLGSRLDGPAFMNLLDTDTLERTCLEAGFNVERVSFIDRDDFKGAGRMDGRENVGLLALKPAR
jgi:SAM-dependent methyltransferase